MNKFNLNNIVTIKLTDRGLNIMKERYDKNNYWEQLNYTFDDIMDCYKYNKDTKEIEIQLWDLAHIFGKELIMGNNKLPCEMDFRFCKTEDNYI